MDWYIGEDGKRRNRYGETHPLDTLKILGGLVRDKKVDEPIKKVIQNQWDALPSQVREPISSAGATVGTAIEDTLDKSRKGLLGPSAFAGSWLLEGINKTTDWATNREGLNLTDITRMSPSTTKLIADVAVTRKLSKVPKINFKYTKRVPKIEPGIEKVKVEVIDDAFNVPSDTVQKVQKLIIDNPGMTVSNAINNVKEGFLSNLPGSSLIKGFKNYADSAAFLFGGGVGTGTGVPSNTFSGGGQGDDPSNEFEQLVFNLEKSDTPIPRVTKTNLPKPSNFDEKINQLTYQELQSLGPAFKSYWKDRPYKDAATLQGYEDMTLEVEKVFSDLLGDDFDRDLVRQYMKAVSDHEAALTNLQKILNENDPTKIGKMKLPQNWSGKLLDKQHANALRNLRNSGRMLGNKGLFPAFNYQDVLDQSPQGREKVNIEREGNRPDRLGRGADFQRTLMRVLGKPLSLHESILYWYDQNMFYFWKEASPLQRQQLVDSSRTKSGGRIKSELTVAENINQALEAMNFGKETMSGKLGRPLTDKERLKALVDLATSELLKKRKYSTTKREITGETIVGSDGKPIKTKSGEDLKEKQIIQKKSDLKGPRQGNVFYDIDTGEGTDYSPDPGVGSSWDIEDPDPNSKYK